MAACGTDRTCRGGLTISVDRGGPELANVQGGAIRTKLPVCNVLATVANGHNPDCGVSTMLAPHDPPAEQFCRHQFAKEPKAGWSIETPLAKQHDEEAAA